MNELKRFAPDSVERRGSRPAFLRSVSLSSAHRRLEKYQQHWQDPQRRRADFHLFWPGKSYREDQSILIAGCGTSQAAKHAMRWPAAQVTGIDVSATSVRYTEDLKRKYSLNNLRVYQLPIERVSDLERSFDQIVCTGVLHHLEDPDAGLRALRGALKPDGAMQLMVYAPYGRAGVYMLQDFCRRTGIHATDVDIRDLIAALSAMPPGHPLNNLMREASEFRQEGCACRCSSTPARPRVFGPAIIRFHRTGRTDIRPMDEASTLLAPLRSYCANPAGFPNSAAFLRQSNMPP